MIKFYSHFMNYNNITVIQITFIQIVVHTVT